MLSIPYHLCIEIGSLKANIDRRRVLYQIDTWTSSRAILSSQFPVPHIHRIERKSLEYITVERVPYLYRANGTVDCDRLESNSVWKSRRLCPIPVGHAQPLCCCAIFGRFVACVSHRDVNGVRDEDLLEGIASQYTGPV